MDLSFKEIFAAFMILFAVIDIVGNVPIIIDLRKKAGHIQKWESFFNCWDNNDLFLVYWRKHIVFNWD